jgi:hypothetical protein
MMHHYTNRKGFNAIRAAHAWHFKARKPRGRNPVGAYFTDLPRWTPKLAKQLRIPIAKTKYVFVFTDIGDLTPLRGGRGRYIFYSPQDYNVDRSRHQYEGQT